MITYLPAVNINAILNKKHIGDEIVFFSQKLIYLNLEYIWDLSMIKLGLPLTFLLRYCDFNIKWEFDVHIISTLYPLPECLLPSANVPNTHTINHTFLCISLIKFILSYFIFPIFHHFFPLACLVSFDGSTLIFKDNSFILTLLFDFATLTILWYFCHSN